MRQFYTRRNITISLSISLAIVGFFVWYTYRNMRIVSDDSYRVTTTLRGLKVLEDIKDDMQDMETGQRGYIISGKKEFLEPYYAALIRLAKDTPELKNLSEVYPERKPALTEVLRLVNEKIRFGDGSISAVDNFGKDSAYMRIQSGRGHQVTDEFRVIIDRIESEDRKILANSNKHREQVAKETAELFITLAAVFILILFLLIVRIRRDLMKREANEKKMSYLADLVEQAGDAIISADTTFVILSWNKGAEEMYGYTAVETVGKKFHEVLKSTRSDAERAAVVEMIRHSGYFSEELQYTKKNRQSIFVQASYTLLKNRDGEVIGCSIVHRDITDKKLSEQLLTEFNQKLNTQVLEKTAATKLAMERFRVIAKATNDVVWDVDLTEGGNVWWNENITRKFGYTLKNEFTNSTFWEDHIHPDDKDRVLRNINSVLKDESLNTWSDEYRFRKANGDYLNVYDRSYIMRDEIGRPFRMIGSMADITDLLLAKKELQQSEENYQTLIEQATNGIIVIHLDGRIILANPAACSISGFTEQELLSKRVEDVLEPGELKNRPLRFEELREGENLVLERTIINNLGEQVIIEVNARLMKEGRVLAFIRDITEKKKAEEEIVLSNARFHIISKATSDIVWDWDPQTGRLWWNDNYYSALGFRKQKEFVDISTWYDSIHPRDRDRVVNKIHTIISGDQLTWRDEYRYAKADGSHLYFLDRGHILRDKEGKACRLIGSMVDITDLFNVQEKLRESEDRYRTLIEQATDAILIYSIEGTIHSYNNSAAVMTGYTHEEFAKLRLPDVFVGEIISDPKIYSAVLNGKAVTVYRQFRRKDGELLDVEIVAKLISDDKILAFARDITDRRRAEDVIKDNELLFRVLTANAPVGIFQTDANGKTIFVNKTWLGYTGMQFEEALGDGWLNAVHPEDKEHLKQVWNELSVKGLPSVSEYRLIDKAGEIKWVHGNAVPLYNNIGEISGHIGTIADTTERKIAEELLRKSEETLRLIMSSSLDATICMDMQGNITVWTPQAEKTFGWPEHEVLGRPFTATILSPESRGSIETYIEQGDPKMDDRLIELTGLNKTGEQFPIELSIVPVQQDSDRFYCAFVRDISERKLAEETIRINEEKYRMLVEQAIDAIALYDQQGKILDVNTGAVTLLGYSREELKTMTLSQILTEKEIADNPVRYDVLAGGESTVKQRMMWRRDGTRVQTEVRSQQLPDGRFLSVIRDLTDRIEAQKKIQIEKELSDKLIDSLPGVFYWYDENGKFLRWNKQFEAVTGYSGKEIAQMQPTDFFRGDDLALIKKRIGDVFNDGYGDAEADFTAKDGSTTPYYFKAIRINFDDRPSLLGTGLDISERRRAEAELKQSEEKYKLLFRNSPLPMWVFEKATYLILDVNEAALNHYGYTREEFLALNLLDLRPWQEHAAFLRESKKGSSNSRTHGIWKHVKKDGSIIDVEITGHDIKFNNRLGRLIVSVDITDKLRNDAEIKKTSEELRKLADHLHQIREEERTHIAREIHDELGQYLTVLKMDVSWLNKKIGPDAEHPVKDKLKDLLEMLDGTVKTVRRISSDLRPSLLDDLGLVAAIEWQLSEFEKRSGIQTKFLLKGNSVKLTDDIKTGVFRIFQESLTNVARHAEAKNVHVEFHYTRNTFILKIEDDGRGFDKDQVERTRTLGILGMKERATMIGGTYDISSTPHKGTVVLVTVPFVTLINQV